MNESTPAFQEFQQLHRLILESAGEGIFGLDLKGRHTFVNPTAARLLGYTVEELQGRPSHRTWHHMKTDGSPYPEDKCPIYQAYKDGRIHHGDDELFWRKDGTSFPAEYRSAPLWNSAGSIVGAVVTFQDITDRREREKTVQGLMRKNDVILQEANEGILGLDSSGHHIFVNRAASRLLGYAPSELLGHALWHHTRSDGRRYPDNQCPIYGAYKNGLVHHGNDDLFWKKDGSSFPAECTSTPIRDEYGYLMGAVVTFRDITEHKRLEAKLSEETRIAEVSRVLGDISHDLKNLLMPVLNGASLLEEEFARLLTLLPASIAAQLGESHALCSEITEMIHRNAKRIHERVQGVADAVKGVITPPNFAPCRIDNVVNDVISTLRLYADERNVRLTVEGLTDLPTIEADERRLFNALYNLINNAIPEVPPGGSVAVRGAIEDEGSTLHLVVADTGRGMPPDVRERLFTDGAISQKAGGTGLGTKIVKDVVEAHRGTISVDSEEGLGTTCHLRLPVTQRPSVSSSK
ncbi:MAG: PAS domain S-box protein [Nitrospirae bacterium]|nr:MAG: PAS domain S-box protein [Nitrospirota bacterium]